MSGTRVHDLAKKLELESKELLAELKKLGIAAKSHSSTLDDDAVETVLAKLSELLFVEAVRRYADTLPEGQTGWLAGLRDRHVSRALALMHRDITHSWTVDELGREVGLSRSALAERFTRLIGEAPMHYLANWRMQVAAQKLRNNTESLANVASTVGYESEAAFSRAFKKAFGTAPATWRRSKCVTA